MTNQNKKHQLKEEDLVVPKTDLAPGRTLLHLLGSHLHTLKSPLTTLKGSLIGQDQDKDMWTVFYSKNSVLKNYPNSIN